MNSTHIYQGNFRTEEQFATDKAAQDDTNESTLYYLFQRTSFFFFEQFQRTSYISALGLQRDESDRL